MSLAKKYTVKILYEREAVDFDDAGVRTPVMDVMYASRLVGANRISIPLGVYSEEERNKRIRADIERLLKEPPKTLEV